MRRLGAEGNCSKFMRQFYVRLKGARNDVRLGMLALPNIRFGHTEMRQDDRVCLFLNILQQFQILRAVLIFGASSNIWSRPKFSILGWWHILAKSLTIKSSKFQLFTKFAFNFEFI
jgi:hypothetical protein